MDALHFYLALKGVSRLVAAANFQHFTDLDHQLCFIVEGKLVSVLPNHAPDIIVSRIYN